MLCQDHHGRGGKRDCDLGWTIHCVVCALLLFPWSHILSCTREPPFGENWNLKSPIVVCFVRRRVAQVRPALHSQPVSVQDLVCNTLPRVDLHVRFSLPGQQLHSNRPRKGDNSIFCCWVLPVRLSLELLVYNHFCWRCTGWGGYFHPQCSSWDCRQLLWNSCGPTCRFPQFLFALGEREISILPHCRHPVWCFSWCSHTSIVRSHSLSFCGHDPQESHKRSLCGPQNCCRGCNKRSSLEMGNLTSDCPLHALKRTTPLEYEWCRRQSTRQNLYTCWHHTMRLRTHSFPRSSSLTLSTVSGAAVDRGAGRRKIWRSKEHIIFLGTQGKGHILNSSSSPGELSHRGTKGQDERRKRGGGRFFHTGHYYQDGRQKRAQV